MEGWKELVLSLPGLPDGTTELKTTVTTDFFTQFEESPIGGASYEVRVVFDKKPGLYILHILANGWHEAECDRCLELIRIPGQADYQYFFHLKSEAEEVADEEVFLLDEGTVELDLRPLVYESIVLSLPIINVYNCEEDDQAPCDPKVLDILRDKENIESESTNPSWDVLKDIKFED